jgi:hypothetical protein
MFITARIKQVYFKATGDKDMITEMTPLHYRHHNFAG